MRSIRITIFSTVILVFFCAASMALKGVVADGNDIARLKKDLLDKKVKIGKTRLMDIQDEYGEAPNITDDDKRITYDYNDLRISFERKRVWKEWSYDGFREPIYTDDVDNLRYDLESKDLTGKNITYTAINRSYGEPTESQETTGDGEWSTYYYGDVKLVFENVIVVRSWRGSNLTNEAPEEVLGTSPSVVVAEESPSEALAQE